MCLLANVILIKTSKNLSTKHVSSITKLLDVLIGRASTSIAVVSAPSPTIQNIDVTRMASKSQTPSRSESTYQTGHVNQFYTSISHPWPCPIRANILSNWLTGYDQVKAIELLNGISQGFHIPSAIINSHQTPYTNQNRRLITMRL